MLFSLRKNGPTSLFKEVRPFSRSPGKERNKGTYKIFFERILGCNGRALDRVTKQKHQADRQKVSKNCPRIVFAVPPDNFRTFFRDIFGHFVDIPFF